MAVKAWLTRQTYRLKRSWRNLFSAVARRFPLALRLLPARIPLRAIHHHDTATARGELMIFLPGISDLIDDFEINGFIQAVFRHPLPTDLIVVDAHVGYYARGTILKRLHEDIVLPARAHGYTTRWLVGISMGGLGALLYAREYPGDIDGLMLLAPYLGEARLITEIQAVGGVKSWSRADRHAANVLHHLWRWLQDYDVNSTQFPTIYLGFGDADPFASANRRLAELLPANHVFVTAGGHDWPTWQRLWERFLGTRAGRRAEGVSTD